MSQASPATPLAAQVARRETRSTCCYCGVGCGVLIESVGGQIVGVRGDPQHPANFGRLCSKGLALHRTADAAVTEQVRLLQPQRRAARGGALLPVPWNAALDHAAERLLDIRAREGPEAIGFYVSGQFLTEDYYVFNKLAKGLLQTNNIDSNSRLCMSSAVAGYKRTLGADAPPCSYEDIERATMIFIAGANPAYAHPVLFRRIEDAKRAWPQLRIVVADPRRTASAELADLHLPILPGTDVALFHGMLHVLAWEGRLDSAFIAAHTNGFDALRERIADFTPRVAARICGIEEVDLVRAARWFAGEGAESGDERRPASLSLYCQGLNQSVAGTDKNAALINLHLATGQIGRSGAGPFSLTGQPNAMGGREVGAMANLLGGHRELSDAGDRAEMATLWGLPQLPALPGLSAVELFEAAAEGKVKALWIACTNPAQSLPDQATVRAALRRAEFVVLQEAFATTATAAYADLLLPAAAWGEKEGTVTNSERRISRVRAAVAPPGAARPDWHIGVELARRLESALRPGAPSLFPYERAEEIWNEHRTTTLGRDLDIGGLSYTRLEAGGPVQWPCPSGAGRTRLYEDGRFATPDGRARFAAVAYRPSAEPRCAQYPFSLLTGRLRDQWHGMSRSGTAGVAFGHAPEPAVELHAADMRRLGLSEGGLVRLRSRLGALVLPVRASAELRLTQAFVPMHWGGEYLGGALHADGDAKAVSEEPSGGINALTTPRRCPESRQPELKHVAVAIEKVVLPWQLLAMAWLPRGEVLRARERLRELFHRFDYVSCVPFGSEREGVLLRAAASAAPDAATLDRIEALLGFDAAAALRLADPARGRRRVIRTESCAAGERLSGFMLAGDSASELWLRDLLLQGTPLEGSRGRLLRPGEPPRGAGAPASAQICSCFGITQAQIESELPGIVRGTAASGAAQVLEALQGKLKCGTNCGSCLPELRRLITEPSADRTAELIAKKKPSPEGAIG